MKANILSAIYALLIASSCLNETKPSASSSSNGDVFIARHECVAMGKSKTALDPDLTPTWVRGDAIGVTSASDNNVKCNLISAENGTFSKAGIKGDAPYYAVYPHSSQNSFNGSILTATVPQTQAVSSGQRVSPGALIAACVSTSSELAFKNCVALMQVKITRDNVKQVIIEATGENEFLAGRFTMDISAEQLIPTAVDNDPSLSSSVVLTAADGTLEAGTYYVAVIPTTISGIRISFVNSNDQTETISRDSVITLHRSNGVNFGSFFTYEISTPEDLIRWSKESSKFTAWDVVDINNDIDMSGVAEEYTEAVDFKGVFNGNDHTISGLKTPLFANLYGSVNNLTLNSSINYKGKNDNMPGHNQAVGILAHIAYVTEHSDAQISKVTTNGSLSINRTTAFDKYFVAGGLLGSSNGVKIEDCENYATIKVGSITLTGTSSRLCTGGIVGQIVTSQTSIEGCHNYGNVSISKNCSSEAQCIIGGIAGYVTVHCFISSCLNSGNITNSTASASGFFTGGIIGTIGTVANTNGSSNEAWEIGGITECSNSGAILNNSDYGTAVSQWMGGIIAFANTSNIILDRCNNYGSISLDASKCNIASVGGLFGQVYQTAPSTIQNCNNFVGGTVNINSTECGIIYEGGIVGFTNLKSITILNCVNKGSIVNTGTASGTDKSSIRIGGIAGFNGTGATIGSEGCTNICSNYGTISSYSAQTRQTAIGGITGQASSAAITIYGARNYGDLSFSSTADVESLYMGGIGGIFGTTPTLIGCISNCEIISNCSCSFLNGSAIIARSSSSNTKIHDCKVAGTIFGEEINSDNFDKYLCAYYANSNPKTDLSNNSYLFDSMDDDVDRESTICAGTYNVLSSISEQREPNNTWDMAKSTIATNISLMSCDIMTLNELGPTEIEYIRQQFPQLELIEFPNSKDNHYNNAPGILYNPKRLTKLDEGIYWLSNPETSELITEPGAYSYTIYHGFFHQEEYKASIARACVWGKFLDNKTSKEFYYFATHPHHRASDKESSYYNTEHSLNCGNIRSLLKQIPYVNTENLPYIVAGDMNTDPRYLSYEFFATAGLTSTFEEARTKGVIDSQTNKAPATYPGTTPESYNTAESYRLDHIFHQGFETEHYTNIFTKYQNPDGQKYYPSDHLPIKVILGYN